MSDLSDSWYYHEGVEEYQIRTWEFMDLMDKVGLLDNMDRDDILELGKFNWEDVDDRPR